MLSFLSHCLGCRTLSRAVLSLVSCCAVKGIVRNLLLYKIDNFPLHVKTKNDYPDGASMVDGEENERRREKKGILPFVSVVSAVTVQPSDTLAFGRRRKRERNTTKAYSIKRLE